MAVFDSEVTFIARSRTSTARAFTQRVEVSPDAAHEVGEVVGNGLSGRRYEAAQWELTVNRSSGDAPLDDACREVLSRLDGRQGEIKSLASEFTTELRCWGTSDSSQGGFWLSAEVIRAIAELGCDFYCTVDFEEAVDGP